MGESKRGAGFGTASSGIRRSDTGHFPQRTIRALCIRALVTMGKSSLRQMRRNAADAQGINDQLLMTLLRENKDTDYGRRYDFAGIRSAEEFKQKVPLTHYADYEEYITRIYENGEENVLSSSPVKGFATSSGSIGKPKTIPLTVSQVEIFTKYEAPRILVLADRYRRENGKKLRYARGISVLPRFDERSPRGLPATNVADLTATENAFAFRCIFNLPLGRQFMGDEIDIKYAEARIGLADKSTMFIHSVFAKTVEELITYIRSNWEMLVNDIEKGTVDPSVQGKPEILERFRSMLKPDKERADELRREFEKGFDETILSRIWPNMAVITSIGTSETFEKYADSIRRYAKGIGYDYAFYAASEGLFAVAAKMDDKRLTLLPDSCYFEFLPVDAEDDSHTLSISELEVGKEYEIIITTRSGFYRYKIEDVIRVLEFDGTCPMISFVYRKGQLLNITGEKTNFLQMAESIRRLERLSGVTVRDWCVFVDQNDVKYRYGIVLETEGDEDLSGYADDFEQILRDVNSSYKYYEGKDLIDPPVIYMQKPGSHEEWRQMKIRNGASSEQVKPVNILDTEQKKEFFLSRLR